MKNVEISKKDIFQRFDDKIEKLKDTLPPTGRKMGNSYAAHTFSILLDVLDLEEFNKCNYNNLVIPFSGFGSYTNKKGWKGPCGVVSGATAAIGIIMGSKRKLNPNMALLSLQRQPVLHINLNKSLVR